jgi:hypothetical protein
MEHTLKAAALRAAKRIASMKLLAARRAARLSAKP